MKHRVLIVGYGEMGHALEYLLAEKHDIRIWSLFTQNNLEEEVTKADVILLCLPVNAHVEILLRVVTSLRPHGLCLSIAKGLDETGKTAPQILADILQDQFPFGVLYGPMISEEIRLGRLAFADVALSNPDNYSIIRSLFLGTTLICTQVEDMHGSGWSVILKNVYAILFGIADELQLGGNVRGHLMVSALAELSAIVSSMGANTSTPYSYAGLGDLVTTATSEDSHHHELGRRLARGQFTDISGEGIHTLEMVNKFHLFNYASYPLFALVSEIVATPTNLRYLLDAYVNNLKTW
jgi:glycerol-3-phosphate dehydrogenase (NAD(P)+)